MRARKSEKVWWVVAVCLSLFTACESEPEPTPETPPQWVVEAQERSLEQQNEPAAPAEPEVPKVVDKPLMWTVTTDSGATSTLLGSFHVGTDFPGLPALPENVREAFESSQTVVLEADVGAITLESAARFIVLPPGKSLKKMLGPKKWELLLQQGLAEPEAQLDRMQPHIVTSLLAADWVPNAGARGMDGRFLILARAHEKELRYLETPPEQMRLLSDIITAKKLSEMLERLAEERRQTLDLLQAFRAGDAEQIEKTLFSEEQISQDREFYEKLFWERNRRWIPKLTPYIDKGGAFVTVGAGHLLGDDSVPKLLAEKGYDVRRVE